MIQKKFAVKKITPNYYTEEDNGGYPSNVGKIKSLTLHLEYDVRLSGGLGTAYDPIIIGYTSKDNG